MEPETVTQILEWIGTDASTLAVLVGAVYFLTESIKKKFAPGFWYGWRTDLLALLLSAAASFKTTEPLATGQWWQFGVLVLIVWLVPAGVHKKLKT